MPPTLSLAHALSLGLVQGITEYLPVSADAHVILLGRWLGDDPELLRVFSATLQAAPALAVLILFRRRFDALLRPSHAGKTQFKGRHGWVLYLAAVLPVMAVGLLFKHYFDGLRLQLVPILLGLAAGGVGILWAEHGHKEKGSASVEKTTLRQAFGVGLFQCLALWPGVSRSGATIIGGLVLGLDREAAAEFSFLCGVPVFLAASALQFHHAESRALLMANLPALALGFATSFALALATVAAFMKLLGRISFKPFGWYRLALSPLIYFFSGLA
ncbi:MAG TPA: undecaprenyl-diphosphate phosphatase [bacterium]|nr:undecaprenyl-diphosphate phosphatase [bacterium]